ncbi:MAG: hypothetical protein AAF487_14940 [Bacteroidota bacterium]
MPKSYEELLEYAQKIIERGDGWASLRTYLDSNSDREDWKKEIIQKMRDFEDTLDKKGHERIKAPKSTYDYVLGFGGILFGIFLIYAFLTIDANGIWIGTIPFAFIGLGIRQLTFK